MDAGFWSAMRIRKKWLRDLSSVVFTAYYLIAAEQADEKVRKVRAMLTVDHMRVSWNKGTTPYLSFLQNLLRPRLMRYPPRQIRIPRPPKSDYKEPISAWLYFDGPLTTLKAHTKVVLDIPGGGFVAMDPRTNDDKLMAWAGKTGLPILSLDYKKAPEFPYPYALNECYDVYSTIIATRGRCVGLAGTVIPKIVITGDSAGGNLATSTTLMIIESGSTSTRQYLGENTLPIPTGLVLMYPALDMNIGNWMTDEQMSLIKDRKMRKTNASIMRRKSMQYTLTAGTPHQSDREVDDYFSPQKPSSEDPSPTISSITTPQPAFSTAAPTTNSPSLKRAPGTSHQPEPMKTRLAMSSMLSYFSDRILTPEMMRAMIILYIGPHNRPDFSQDYLLSPILAPDALLALFPKTYFLTGERDPLVDDTVIFAGRLRRAKAQVSQKGREREDSDEDVVEVALIPGISHGFLQFVSVFPEGWKYIFRCGRWVERIFLEAEEKELRSSLLTLSEERYHRRRPTESSGDEDFGLEMSMSSSRKSKAGESDDKGKSIGKEERRQKETLLREEMEKRKVGGDRMGRRRKSMVSLASSEDLLGRRMKGLAGPLTGLGDGGES